jgi:hypothetical protein
MLHAGPTGKSVWSTQRKDGETVRSVADVGWRRGVAIKVHKFKVMQVDWQNLQYESYIIGKKLTTTEERKEGDVYILYVTRDLKAVRLVAGRKGNNYEEKS